MVFFKERVSVNQIIGAMIVIVGVVLYAIADGEARQEEKDE